MAWYDNERKLTHTQTYNNPEVAANDARKAAATGWQVETPTDSDLRMAALGWGGSAIGDFIAGNRQPGDVVVTYTRTPEWLEQHRKR